MIRSVSYWRQVATRLERERDAVEVCDKAVPGWYLRWCELDEAMARADSVALKLADRMARACRQRTLSVPTTPVADAARSDTPPPFATTRIQALVHEKKPDALTHVPAVIREQVRQRLAMQKLATAAAQTPQEEPA